MTSQYFQLSMDLDKWIGGATSFYRFNQLLSEIWENSRPQLTTHNTYVPFGIDALLRQLQTNSFFKFNQAVQKLDISSLVPPSGLETVGELLNFLLSSNARAAPLAGAVVLGIQNWLDAPNIEFAAGTSLSGLWTTAKGNAIPYGSYGTQKLATTFKDKEEFFEHCAKARALNPVIFANGSIKIVGQLHDFLLSCG
ncbi:MAG: hypothetical protein ACR2MG_16295 [Pyrinomonadaceae bacterium]